MHLLEGTVVTVDHKRWLARRAHPIHPYGEDAARELHGRMGIVVLKLETVKWRDVYRCLVGKHDVHLGRSWLRTHQAKERFMTNNLKTQNLVVSVDGTPIDTVAAELAKLGMIVEKVRPLTGTISAKSHSRLETDAARELRGVVSVEIVDWRKALA